MRLWLDALIEIPKFSFSFFYIFTHTTDKKCNQYLQNTTTRRLHLLH